ncbi:MAG TPA: DoxX family protein [Blastocatellia bacterium]|nr:DoxX family protein [Blastocatellia bacterium]
MSKNAINYEAGVAGNQETPKMSLALNIALWAVQVLLALLFLFAGGSKLVMSIEQMQQGPVHLPGAFLRFIGVAEALGGLGLILPQLLRIKPALTPLAAICLAIIMVGATVITLMSGPASMAVVPGVVGILLVFIAYGRRSFFK